MFVGLSLFPGRVFSVQSDLEFCFFLGTHLAMCFTRSKGKAVCLVAGAERHEALLPIRCPWRTCALPAVQDRRMGRGDSTWSPLCINTPAARAVEIAINALP